MAEQQGIAGNEASNGRAQPRALALHAHCIAAGFTPAEVPLLQPVEPFLDLSGEDIRRRLFITTDEQGDELCLRPEFTIPAALDYLKGGAIGRKVEQVFLGPVFRHRAGESGEFIQLGLESIGRADREMAEVDLFAHTLDLVSLGAPARRFTITIGDLALFSSLLDALSLSPATVRRLTLALGEGRLPALLDPAQMALKKPSSRGLERYAGVLEALKGADPAEAKAFVKDLLSIAGIATTGGRSTADIAARFLEQAQADSQGLGAEAAAILRRFLAITGEPDAVVTALRALMAETGLDLGAAIDRFELRISLMEARGMALSSITASAGFARNLNYYSGFVFDVRDGASPTLPVAAGGRYDALFARLGHAVPAMGAAIWLARLEGSAA
jgi:ATP phosphoribosyltransferase regulatory subunit